ncbi:MULTISPECIES: cupredoxin domain-containing protein [unclassified Azospirillum]|uniref:cupredoxin domain-containing protein n=1 Tax=unclassified Azospirillum TaxID=2630922 RepID=UPI000D619681|nr:MULTISPECIES: cupredoxin domain-containing protein [unclassified Azospirillum]PWC91093.1 hypothetical protein TSO5_19750 [Azospirillum sp. TSO5]QCG99315.1 hypothetical protein E6C67_36650 [Azospirillum sp. TSA2s]
MLRTYHFASVLLTVTMAGCAAGTAVETVAPPGYIADAPARTAGVDWTGAEPVNVAMQEYSYQPTTLVFQAGRPYRLHIENHGGTSHTFSSEGYFRAIAARSLTTTKGMVQNPYVKDIEIAPGQSADLAFVPVSPGNYKLSCHEPLHETFGMTGNISIQ